MEQNNYNNNNQQQQPYYGNPPQNGYPQNGYPHNGYPQQGYAPYPNGYYPPVYQQQPRTNPHVEESAGSAFGKSLAGLIMSEFPICSIIAIILSSMGLRLAKQTDEMAAYYRVEAGGKNVAAKVLGTIGLILSIIMTVFYCFFFIAIIATVS
ncbi:MAG: DUF4190 domain-containing protein [Clostridia bacterium]|nr:DUF4190 domain-containing protein [Clostridia bacterium]